jgi:hypothetical protein
MRFFTRSWWESGSEAADERFQAYAAYIDSVRDRLPPDILELDAQHTLHDSEVKEVRCDFVRQAVQVVLNGWNRDLQYRVRYCLNFTEVSEFEQLLPPQEQLEEELGDLGYWECEWIGGKSQVSMLFVSGAEFRVVFQGFSFEHARR